MANPCKWRDTIYPSQTECAQAAGVSVKTVSMHLTRHGHLDRLGIGPGKGSRRKRKPVTVSEGERT